MFYSRGESCGVADADSTLATVVFQKTTPFLNVEDCVRDDDGDWVEVLKSESLPCVPGTFLSATSVLNGTRTVAGITELRTRVFATTKSGVRREVKSALTFGDIGIPPGAPQLLNLTNNVMVAGSSRDESLHASVEVRSYPALAAPNITNVVPGPVLTPPANPALVQIYFTSPINLSNETVCITGVGSWLDGVYSTLSGTQAGTVVVQPKSAMPIGFMYNGNGIGLPKNVQGITAAYDGTTLISLTTSTASLNIEEGSSVVISGLFVDSSADPQLQLSDISKTVWTAGAVNNTNFQIALPFKSGTYSGGNVYVAGMSVDSNPMTFTPGAGGVSLTVQRSVGALTVA